MMTFSFLVSIGVFLVILKTALLPLSSTAVGACDLLVPFIAFLGLYRPLKEGLPAVIFLGIVVDNLSGAPFGLFLTTYIWLYGGSRLIIRFLHAGSLFIFITAVGAAVFIENAYLAVSVKLFFGGYIALQVGLQKTAIETIWGVLLAPLYLGALQYTVKRWGEWLEQRQVVVDGTDLKT